MFQPLPQTGTPLTRRAVGVENVDVQIEFAESFLVVVLGFLGFFCNYVENSMCFPSISLAPYFLKALTCSGIDALDFSKQPTSELSLHSRDWHCSGNGMNLCSFQL